LNNFNISPDKQNALLKMAAQKLGKDPEELKSQLESGKLDSLTQNMDAKSLGQLNSLLQNPKAVEALLGNDKIRAMLGNLGNK